MLGFGGPCAIKHFAHTRLRCEQPSHLGPMTLHGVGGINSRKRCCMDFVAKNSLVGESQFRALGIRSKAMLFAVENHMSLTKYSCHAFRP